MSDQYEQICSFEQAPRHVHVFTLHFHKYRLNCPLKVFKVVGSKKNEQ